MSASVAKLLKPLRKGSPFDKGIAASLPEAYKKFYTEWKLTQPTAVHYIPEEGKWKRNEITNEVRPVQNIPIPLRYPKEFDEQLWGGEAVVQGFQKRDEHARRVPHFWIPQLHRSVIYSEVLNKHMAVVVTNRAIKLINANFGLDHYLLKTPANDLQSLLPLGLKRKILQELEKGCPSYADEPEKQAEIYDRYKQYLAAYTSEEIEWYGYSLQEACKIIKDRIDASRKVVPLKNIYRIEMIEKLKQAEIGHQTAEVDQSAGSWMSRINPFGKKQET